MSLLEEIGPPLNESRIWKNIANSDGPRVSARELGAPRLEWADKRRAFVCGRVCGEVADIEIDNTKDCNMISERLLELLGFAASVRRFNGKLERTFNDKNRKIETLGYTRAKINIGSLQEVFILIVVGNGVLESDVVLSARELKECHGLFVRQPVSVNFEKLPKTVTTEVNPKQHLVAGSSIPVPIPGGQF